jgi:hypothetical protein
MHATRARLPHKRTRKAAPTGKKPSAKKAALQAAPSIAQALPAESLPDGVASLAAHRARRAAQIAAVEIFALVEWIAPARDSWRRGELEIRRSACMPMTAASHADGALLLTDLPGQGDALVLEAAALTELRSGATLVRTLPGMRVTFTPDDLAPALPPAPKPAVILAFPAKA